MATSPATPFPNAPLGSTSESSSSGLGTSSGMTPSPGNDPTQRAAQAAHEAVDRLANKAAPAVERLKTQWSGAAETLHQQADHLSAMQREWAESARSQVRAHPLQSVGIAMAIGWLVGRLTAR